MRIAIAMLAAVTAAGVTFMTAGPAAAQSTGFTGPWAAAITGGDRIQGRGDHDDAVFYGVQAGYDLALGAKARAGIEVEATDSTQKDCRSGTIRAGDRLCTEAGRDLYVGGRVGTMLGTGTMVYAKAGYTNARATALYISSLPVPEVKTVANADGVRLGLGVEHRLGGNSFVKAEYRYANYEAGGERHQLLAGVGLRF